MKMSQYQPGEVSCLAQEGMPKLPSLKGQIAAACSSFPFCFLGLLIPVSHTCCIVAENTGIISMATNYGRISFPQPKWDNCPSPHNDLAAFRLACALCVLFQYRLVKTHSSPRGQVRNTLYQLKINEDGKEPPRSPAVGRYWGFGKFQIVEDQAQKTTHFQRQLVNWRELRESHCKD